MNLDIHLQIDEKDISLSALAKLILRLNATSAESATEQVADTAAMGTHSTVPETPETAAKTATEQVADTAAMGTHSTPAETPKSTAKSATEQVAETAAMGTHSTVPETPKSTAKSATEQVAETAAMGTHSTSAESAKTATVPETTFTMFADPEPDADKMTAIRDKLRTIAKNGRRDEAKAVMLKYRVPALSKLDSLTDEELTSMFNEVMAL